MFFSRVFVVEYVNVNSKKIDPTLVRTLLFRYMDENQGIFNQHNILFFQPAAFHSYLSKYVSIDDFSLTKHYPKSLNVTLAGSPFHVVGYREGHFYELSPSGMIAREVDPAAFAGYPTLITRALTGERIIITKNELSKIDLSFPMIILPSLTQDPSTVQILDTKILNHIETVKRLLRDEKYALLFFRIGPEGNDYLAFTNEGWHIIFSALSDATEQAANLKTLLLTTVKKNRKSLDYIDVRFENRLFYTLRK